MAARPDGGLLRVRVHPRAARAGIAGWRTDGALSVRVTAAPVDGQANAAVGAAKRRASQYFGRMCSLPVKFQNAIETAQRAFRFTLGRRE